MISGSKRNNRSRALKQRTPSPALVQPLEERVLFAHLGHVTTLPDAAERGAAGVTAAIQAPADHHRSKFFATWIEPDIAP